MRPFTNKQWNTTGYPVRIKLQAKTNTQIIVKFTHLFRPLRATAFLMNKERFKDVLTQSNRHIWFWRGVFSFILIAALILFWFVRLKIYAYYLLLNAGVGIFIAAHIGDYFLFFKTDPTDFITTLDYTGTILMNLFLPMFLNALTPVKKRNPIIWKWMYRFIYGMIVFWVLTLIPTLRTNIFTYYSHFYLMTFSAVTFVIQPILLLTNIYHRDKYAIPLFFIYSFYVFASFVNVILPNAGIIADSPFVYNNLLIGSFVEIISFVILMARESVLIYKEKEALSAKIQNQQKEAILSIVTIQEEERNRIGRELHDSIGANMSIIKQQIDKDNKKIHKIISQTIDAVRGISHGLVKPISNKLDLVDELKDLCYQFTNEKLEIHSYFFKWPIIESIESNAHIFRIIQELLQNANKHSQAHNVHLQFIGEDNNSFSINYQDDGIGFDFNQDMANGIGLKNIKNRIELLNGEWSVDTSRNGKGATILIKIAL